VKVYIIYHAQILSQKFPALHTLRVRWLHDGDLDGIFNAFPSLKTLITDKGTTGGAHQDWSESEELCKEAGVSLVRQWFN